MPEMVKLQDFAADCGVTDRAIQKHLKKYEKELAGPFERRRPHGTWLDETAESFIREKMVQQPIIVSDGVVTAENDRLRAEVERLQTKLEKTMDALNASLAEQVRLKDIQIELTANTARIEAAEHEKEALLAEKDRIERAREAAREESTEAKKEAEEARAAAALAADRADKAEKKVEELKQRTLWQRITRAGEE